ncbi:hypothetical protein ACJD0Z_03860 [Flavobacteriaceae bacterium M23B6Z8]
MKQLSIVVVLLALLFSNLSKGQSSETLEKIKMLENKITSITKEEREALKQEVKGINQRLEAGELTEEEAQRLKEVAAEKRVVNIDVRTAKLKDEIASLKKQTDDDEFFTEDEDHYYMRFRKKRKKEYRGRTDSQLVLAVGFNNVIAEGRSFDDSNYKFGGSRFLEIGWAWRTPLFPASNFVRFRYGLSIQVNNLKPTDNRIFVDENGQTTLETFPLDLDKSKLKLTNLVVPIHFEFGPTRTYKGENYRYSIRRKFKIGLGGYAGFNIGTRQKLKYDEGGERIKEKIKGDFNTSDLVYGVSGYLSWGSTGLYVKYDLSPIFDDNQPKQRNISLGVRFDMD